MLLSAPAMISVLWSDAASLPPLHDNSAMHKRPSGGPPDAILGFLIEQKKNKEKDAHPRKITDRGCLQSGQRHMFEVYLADS